MDKLDYLNTAISFLSLVIAAIAMVRARRADILANNLAAKQIKEIDLANEKRERPSLILSFENDNRRFSFKLTNIGDGSAYNVRPTEGNMAALMYEQLSNYFPIAELRPGQNFAVPAFMSDLAPRKVEQQFAWEERDGRIKNEILVASTR